eukprot:5882594-Alexandrium_andersonii.AAC.1
MLDGALPAHARPPARGAPGSQTSGKVCVHIRAESGPVVLPREVGDAPRARNQVPDQPDKRGPI